MRTDRKYLVAVVLLAVLAVAFGVFGTVAPPLAEEGSPVQPQQESSSESVGHFQNPPTYDSGWFDITTKTGQYVTLKHGLNTTEVVVDITGKQSLDPNGGALAWSKTYGGADHDYASFMVQTSDGGYALAGYTDSYGAGNDDFWLVKTDGSGVMQWSKTYGGADHDYASFMVQTGDGGYALAGHTDSFGAGLYDFWLVETDSAGTMQWNKTYGGADYDFVYSLVQTGDGGYALAGYTNSYGVGGDFWLVETDSAGTMQWSKTYGGAGSDVAYSLVQTGDGGYTLAGYTNSYGVGGDFWLVKTDSAGTMLWNSTYGGADEDVAYSLVQTSDGGYALAGYTWSFDAGSGDFWLVKTDSAGNVLWNKTYGGAGDDVAYSLVLTVDGGYAVAGYTYSYGAGSQDFWLVRTDPVGNVQWNKTYGGTKVDYATSLVQTSDGGYALAGYTNSFGAGLYDSWLVKVRPEMNREHQRNLGGTILIPGWSQTYGGTGNDLPRSVIQTSDGGYAIAGGSNSFGASSDMWLVKTDSVGTLLWSKTYGGTGGDGALSVIQTSDRGFALSGSTSSYGAGNYDFWLVKTDWAGNSQWNKTYGGAEQEEPWSVVQTNDGGYALAGFTDSYGSGNNDFFLVKTQPDGTLEWNKTYGGARNDNAYSVVQTFDGGYAIGGWTNSSGAGLMDLWLVKTNSAGLMLWNKTFGGTSNEVAYALVQANDGGFALAGFNSDNGGDFLVVKFSSAGTMEWSKTYGGPGVEVAHALVQTLDGGYALAGSANPIPPVWDAADFWLVKTDSLGNMQWSQSYGTLVNDVAHSIVQTRDGGYAMAGQTLPWATLKSDSLLVKTDVEMGLTRTGLTNTTIVLYRGKTDLYWNYVRVRIWTIKEPSWIYGDINMDGIVDAKDLYILGRNYGKTFSLLSLGGIVAVAGVRTVRKRKQTKQPSDIS